MNGRRAKQLRKQALALHPEGSDLGFQPLKNLVNEAGEVVDVRGQWKYTGFRRAYQDLKRSYKHGQHS